MRKILPMALCAVLLCANVQAADEKIDPATYICAELVTASISGQPPLYEGLQLDGYLAGKENMQVADANALPPLLMAVSDSCSAKPAEKALDHWKNMRRQYLWLDEGLWRADKTTCADYAANPDDGSGFVIWLDAWQRGQSGKTQSVLESQQTLDKFLEACKANPQKLMLDVIRENAK